MTVGKGNVVSRGSEWRRWEPHIHTPGTVLNNQFGAGDRWANYLTTLEQLTPKIEAIAVTDYYVTDNYEEVLRQHSAGDLPDVQLTFPNVEVRLDVTARSGFVNLHLLVCRRSCSVPSLQFAFRPDRRSSPAACGGVPLEENVSGTQSIVNSFE